MTAPQHIEIEGLKVHYPVQAGLLRRVSGQVRAVDGISFEMKEGETVGLVGESGSGKTTTGRALLGLAPLTDGHIRYFGREFADARRKPGLYRLGQMVFQDPYGSLNPRMTVEAMLREVVTVHRVTSPEATGARVRDLIDSVGLRPEIARRHPHELSGGQRQRVAIARALAIEPSFIVCDEVVSALDVSIRGQILNLLRDLQRQKKLSYLFITHDLSVARYVSHQIVVMYGGKVMERAPRDRLFTAPHHPYTHALLSAVPVPDPRIERNRARVEVKAETPDPADPPPGCRFHRSCVFATSLCREQEPMPETVTPGHVVACHHWNRDAVRSALAATSIPLH